MQSLELVARLTHLLADNGASFRPAPKPASEGRPSGLVDSEMPTFRKWFRLGKLASARRRPYPPTR